MIRDIDPIPTNTRLIASAPELLQALQAAQAKKKPVEAEDKPEIVHGI